MQPNMERYLHEEGIKRRRRRERGRKRTVTVVLVVVWKIMHVVNELTVKLCVTIQRTLVGQSSSTSRLPCEHHIFSNNFSCSSRCVAIHTQCWLFEHWAM